MRRAVTWIFFCGGVDDSFDGRLPAGLRSPPGRLCPPTRHTWTAAEAFGYWYAEIERVHLFGS